MTRLVANILITPSKPLEKRSLITLAFLIGLYSKLSSAAVLSLKGPCLQAVPLTINGILSLLSLLQEAKRVMYNQSLLKPMIMQQHSSQRLTVEQSRLIGILQIFISKSYDDQLQTRHLFLNCILIIDSPRSSLSFKLQRFMKHRNHPF